MLGITPLTISTALPVTAAQAASADAPALPDTPRSCAFVTAGDPIVDGWCDDDGLDVIEEYRL